MQSMTALLNEEEELYFEMMSHSPFHNFCEFEGKKKKEDEKKRKVSWVAY